ncbi:hypothetical protein HLI03_19095 [Rhizobium laguerreae]|uniref:hypothetical protein n=1 Tax=Rhizobium laguerreae TaxID=1076926 RepID=UPI0014785793|nr:hypothetical protein [Rhizobium laguerreae]NNH43738.1 hypothetical protein [Rhizobium laguerreae]
MRSKNVESAFALPHPLPLEAKTPAGPGISARSFGPTGVDPRHWAFATVLGSCIVHLTNKRLLRSLGLFDGPAEVLNACWTKMQEKEAARSPEMAAWLTFDPISVPEFNFYLTNYHACDSHCLALVPLCQWTKPIADWDDHVYAVTLTLSIEFTHPKAKLRQQSLDFAAKYVASQPELVMKSAAAYRAYQTEVDVENRRRAERALLPLTMVDRRFVERMASWFPKLVERAASSAAASASKAA